MVRTFVADTLVASLANSCPVQLLIYSHPKLLDVCWARGPVYSFCLGIQPQVLLPILIVIWISFFSSDFRKLNILEVWFLDQWDVAILTTDGYLLTSQGILNNYLKDVVFSHSSVMLDTKFECRLILYLQVRTFYCLMNAECIFCLVFLWCWGLNSGP